MPEDNENQQERKLEQADSTAEQLDRLSPGRVAFGDTTELQGRIDALTAELETERSTSTGLRDQVKLGAAKYKESLLAMVPAIPPSLVSGQTFEDVEASVAQAREIVEAVKAQSESGVKGQLGFRPPVGNPGRTPPDTSGMSAMEKIKLGLSSI